MPQLHSAGIEGRLVGVWERWDACWYLRIATFGYEPGEPGVAFFPLYPLLIRLAGPLVGGNLGVAALVVSAVGFIAALAVLHSMVRTDFDRRSADRSILYLAIFPTAFFFFAPFTESLFLALAVGAIYLARTRRFSLAIPIAVLAGLTRPQGMLLAIPLVWEAFLAAREQTPMPMRVVRAGSAFIAAAAPALAFVLFVTWSSATTGVSPFAAEQGHWGYAMAPPWDVLSYAWRWMLDPANAGFASIQALTAFHLVLIAIFVVLFGVGLRRLPPTYSLYVAPQLFLLIAGGPATPLASASRYMLAMFPIFVVLGGLGSRRHFHTTWVVASTLGLGLLLVAFLMNVPVG